MVTWFWVIFHHLVEPMVRYFTRVYFSVQLLKFTWFYNLNRNFEKNLSAIVVLLWNNLQVASKSLCEEHGISQTQSDTMILHLGKLALDHEFTKYLKQVLSAMLFDSNSWISNWGGHKNNVVLSLSLFGEAQVYIDFPVLNIVLHCILNNVKHNQLIDFPICHNFDPRIVKKFTLIRDF